MPFKEIKPLKDFIRVHEKSITISTSFLNYFMEDKVLQKVRVFIDEENSLVGLQRASEGYKISQHGGGYVITCMEISKKIETGIYFPKWDSKQEMLIFKY
jgi:hypothetical protein